MDKITPIYWFIKSFVFNIYLNNVTFNQPFSFLNKSYVEFDRHGSPPQIILNSLLRADLSWAHQIYRPKPIIMGPKIKPRYVDQPKEDTCIRSIILGLRIFYWPNKDGPVRAGPCESSDFQLSRTNKNNLTCYPQICRVDS